MDTTERGTTIYNTYIGSGVTATDIKKDKDKQGGQLYIPGYQWRIWGGGGGEIIYWVKICQRRPATDLHESKNSRHCDLSTVVGCYQGSEQQAGSTVENTVGKVVQILY